MRAFKSDLLGKPRELWSVNLIGTTRFFRVAEVITALWWDFSSSFLLFPQSFLFESPLLEIDFSSWVTDDDKPAFLLLDVVRVQPLVVFDLRHNKFLFITCQIVIEFDRVWGFFVAVLIEVFSLLFSCSCISSSPRNTFTITHLPLLIVEVAIVKTAISAFLFTSTADVFSKETPPPIRNNISVLYHHYSFT